MPLKRYQQRVLAEVRQYLDFLAAEQAAGAKHPALDAWTTFNERVGYRGPYGERKDGLGRDLPTFCIKVPTGGGKTLLATQVLGLAYQTILKERNGAGLVLWVVPSDQIYRDTLKAFRDRRHFYRESLEYALSRRLEVWEKQDILRLTPNQLANNLNVLMLKLPGANRVDKEQLKFFRDSGGNIVMHFPPEDEPEKQRELKQRVPNLDMVDGDLVKTSLANLVRLCEPVVILDEGHKATSDLARSTIEGFNPRIVVELSATPHDGANVLVSVGGQELLDEEMIKLPINVSNSNETNWKDVLTKARDRRRALQKAADEAGKLTGRHIRPIVLVQVERTGADQRDSGHVHAEDVKEHLIERLNVPEAAIAIKSSDKDDIEGIDLLSDECPIEWIITKAALQEGWDCPFAYVLVSLNNTAKEQTMTQLVGRVLRQPQQARLSTEYQSLNESYVYCLRKRAADITKEVKKALEKEGYQGDAASVVDRSSGSGSVPSTRTATIKPLFQSHYTKPFEGKIYLPRFSVRTDDDGAEPLDYYRHLLSRVNVDEFGSAGADWDLRAALAAAKEQFYRINLGDADPERLGEALVSTPETDEQAVAWVASNLPFDHFSHKQVRSVVRRVIQRLTKANPDLVGRLALVKFELRRRIEGFIQHETDEQTKAAFERLFKADELCFYLECVECRFEIPASVELRFMKQLRHDNDEPVQRSLFDYVPDDLNEYEKSVALYLDSHPQVLWWYRNLVGPENFSVQGYRRNPIYPDFVVQEGRDQKPVARVMVLESKGKHLKGSEDTNYKRDVADYFNRTGREVPWQELAAEFEDHRFRFQILDEGEYADRDWKDELRKLLEVE